MLDFNGRNYCTTYPIRVGEKFVMSGECFNTISDLGENNGYPSYGFNDHEYVFGEENNATDVLFLFEYIGNGKVRENSTGKIFEIRQCDWIYFSSCYSDLANCAYPTYETNGKVYTLFSDGEFENHPEVLEVKDVVDYVELNYAVAYYKNNPLVVAYDLIHVSSLDDIDSINVVRKYNSNTDEQRAEFINKYTRLALDNLKTFGPILEENAKRLGIVNTRRRKPKKEEV
jgi:hypothetical protein